jgi:pyruvate formate lyase activating enzyme
MQCGYCEWRCDLDEQRYGVCQMYDAHEGVIRERFPNRWSTYAISRMESLPFYHVSPGSRTMTIGTMSCNFRCRYCSNAYVALDDPGQHAGNMYELTPEELVHQARKLECRSIVFNVNEPTVSLPSLLALKPRAEQAGLPVGCLTNAYTTEEGTELLASIFDFFNIGLKGISSGFYKEYIGVQDVEPVLRNIRRLAAIRHVEVTTPVIQGVNDDTLQAIAEFLARIDPEIPWHVFRLLPEHEMKAVEYPSIQAINQSLDSARNLLANVYFHNFVGSDWVNTRCPQCGHEVVERISLGCGGDKLDRFGCPDNRCARCGREIRMFGTVAPTFTERVVCG